MNKLASVFLFAAAILGGCGGGQEVPDRGERLAEGFAALGEAELAGPERSPAKAQPFRGDGSRTIAAARSWSAHRGNVSGLAFTPDGAWLVTAGYEDYQVCLWSTATGQAAGKAKAEQRPTDLVVAGDGSVAVVADAYGRLSFYPLEGNKLGQPRVVESGAGRQPRLALDPGRPLLAAVSTEGPLALWTLDGTAPLRLLKAPHGLRSAAFAPDRPLLAAGGAQDPSFILFYLGAGQGRRFVVPRVGDGCDTMGLAFSPDGRYLVTGHNDSSITIWDMTGPRIAQNFFVRDAATMAAAYAPGGDCYATGHSTGKIYLWPPRGSDQLQELSGHQGTVGRLAFSPDGSTMASGGEDGRVILWR